MNWMEENIFMAIVGVAAIAGAAAMKFSGLFMKNGNSHKTNTSYAEDRMFMTQILQELKDLNSIMVRVLAESTEMRKVMHTNTRVMDDVRQGIGDLRVEIAKLEGRIR